MLLMHIIQKKPLQFASSMSIKGKTFLILPRRNLKQNLGNAKA
ncbi:hypothetical protein L950_0210595 [Sphingobacterium sp. IITKGP-BTPF85]|nr:hypothetical protein L950_0210595 [Sphingobacterium sp. IITKGP-BTPF85]